MRTTSLQGLPALNPADAPPPVRPPQLIKSEEPPKLPRMATTPSSTSEDSNDGPDKYWFPRSLIRIFLLLPDPLPLPDRYTYVRTEPFHPVLAAKLEAAGDAIYVPGGRWLLNLELQRKWMPQRATEPSAEAAPSVATMDELRQEHALKPRLHRFVSITRLWQGDVGDIGLFTDKVAFQKTRRRVDEVTSQRLMPQDDQENQNGPQYLRRDYTIAEVVVPYFISDDTERAVRFSLNLALKAVRHIQEALYAARRSPRRHITTELLSPIINYEVGEVDSASAESDDLPVREWVAGMTVANDKIKYLLRETMLSSIELENFNNIMWRQLRTAPFNQFLEIRRRAEVALRRDGDNRASVIWSATAAEYLFDELLRLMMWESNKTPEECVEIFRDRSIVNRVTSKYGDLSGDLWDLQKDNPVTAWKVSVADLRNLVVHDLEFPTQQQAEAALKCIDDLVSHIGDLLVAKFENYWRTAFQLLGGTGLASRGWFDKYQEKSESVWEPDWMVSFSRWRLTNRLILGPKRQPDLKRSTVLFVWGRNHAGYWVRHDPVTCMAIPVTIKEHTIDPAFLAEIIRNLDGPQLTTDERAASATFDSPPQVRKSHGPWRERHDLLPFHGAKVLGDDISDDWFTWRPRSSPKFIEL